MQLVFKERVARNVYEATNEVFHYVGPMVGPGVPVANMMALIFAALLIIFLFAAWQYAFRT